MFVQSLLEVPARENEAILPLFLFIDIQLESSLLVRDSTLSDAHKKKSQPLPCNLAHL